MNRTELQQLGHALKSADAQAQHRQCIRQRITTLANEIADLTAQLEAYDAKHPTR